MITVEIVFLVLLALLIGFLVVRQVVVSRVPWNFGGVRQRRSDSTGSSSATDTRNRYYGTGGDDGGGGR